MMKFFQENKLEIKALRNPRREIQIQPINLKNMEEQANGDVLRFRLKSIYR